MRYEVWGIEEGGRMGLDGGKDGRKEFLFGWEWKVDVLRCALHAAGCTLCWLLTWAVQNGSDVLGQGGLLALQSRLRRAGCRPAGFPSQEVQCQSFSDASSGSSISQSGSSATRFPNLCS